MTKDEAMQMALDALRLWSNDSYNYGVPTDCDMRIVGREGINALEAALAQPEPEPVAWLYVSEDGDFRQLVLEDPENNYWKPLYTAPPQRKPLTDDEVISITKQFALSLAFPYGSKTTPEMFARAIEAAHGIGEKV